MEVVCFPEYWFLPDTTWQYIPKVHNPINNAIRRTFCNRWGQSEYWEDEEGWAYTQRSFFSNRLCTHCSSFCTSVTYSNGMNYPSIIHVVSVIHIVSLGQVFCTVLMTYLTCLESLYDWLDWINILLLLLSSSSNFSLLNLSCETFTYPGMCNQQQYAWWSYL